MLHNDVNHFVDSEVVDEVESALVKIDKNRLQHQHGVSSSVDNVFFLEQHPYFFPKDEEDEQENTSAQPQEKSPSWNDIINK